MKTNEITKDMDYKFGWSDGKASRGFKNPIHNNWSGKTHPNPDYNRGYWEGFAETK